ncbi:MAG: ribosome small subunit-dependent GTPase A [Alistipes sp.]|nr:ribosome small subunit-dependent GTPase A [Alistipes sp.]
MTESSSAQQRIEGIVISSTGSWYEVSTESGMLTCRIRGRLRLKGIRSTNPVVVGDRVMVEPDGDSSAIVEILPRHNYVIRRASNLSKESHIIAANIDRALLIVTLHSPTTAREFVDRFLVTCEAYRVPVTIVLGKADMLVGEYEAEAEEFEAIYGDAGYDIIRLSSTTGAGIEQIRELLRGRTTLVAGNSGVGKSTLVGYIDPTLDIRTGEISESHHKGKHTTTFSTMYPIEGGYIIDTPGIKGFGLIDIEGRELCRYFPEMMRLAPDCRFYNCTHTHEPGCAVREAVEQGFVAWSRYESYLKILDEDDKYRK